MLAIVALVSTASAETWFRYIDRPGFKDPKHTRADRYQFSELVAASRNSFCVGHSMRFFGTPGPLVDSGANRSAWMSSTLGGTKSIGFYDAIHTSDTGLHTSEVLKFGPGWSSTAIGHSTRYHGGAESTGQTAWTAEWWGGTRRIGLFYDAPETAPPQGRLNNYVLDINEAGETIGYATTNTSLGDAAWRTTWDGVTSRIGFYDAAHGAGDANNMPVALNPSGDVIGRVRFGTSQVAWLQLQNSGLPVEVGLYDAAHTAASGRKWSEAVAINANRFVIGRSEQGRERTNGAESLYTSWLRKADGEVVILSGQDFGTAPLLLTDGNIAAGETYVYPDNTAWTYDANSGAMRSVGLPPAPGTGVANNRLLGLSAAGVALGRTNYTESWDRRIWLADLGGQTHPIGFYGSEFHLPGDSFLSELVAFNDEGVAIGTSERLNGRLAAWIASPVTGLTYPLGLSDADHTGPGGLRNSVPERLTNSKFVAGYSTRYGANGEPAGQTAWIYNSPKKAYAPIVLSVRASDGYAYSRVHHLIETGVAVGTYTKFAEDGTDLGDRAFVWITGRGVFDLEDRLNVDPESVNWEYLANALFVTEGDLIVGHGVPLGEATSQGVFSVQLKWW